MPRKYQKANPDFMLLHFRATKEQVERWKRAARKDGRSFSNWVVINLDRILGVEVK